MKYIMMENESGAMVPVVFSELLTHADVFDALGRGQRLVSAGFYAPHSHECSGESESLQYGRGAQPRERCGRRCQAGALLSLILIPPLLVTSGPDARHASRPQGRSADATTAASRRVIGT